MLEGVEHLAWGLWGHSGRGTPPLQRVLGTMPSKEAAAEPGQCVGAHGLGQSSEVLAAWGSLVLKELGPLAWQSLLCFCFPSHT